jgi:PTS system N-acetylglucosamine-specific IIB component
MSKACEVIALLGGDANITDLEPCITRLRVQVKDPARVDQEGLKAAGAHGVIVSGRVVQVVIGPGAEDLAGQIAAIRS